MARERYLPPTVLDLGRLPKGKTFGSFSLPPLEWLTVCLNDQAFLVPASTVWIRYGLNERGPYVEHSAPDTPWTRAQEAEHAD